ncbi:MAG: hypothetical protein IT455_05640 [Planctomycetes bacterium]|nr:hypothetical protein [Planctomycetota bacterium]
MMHEVRSIPPAPRRVRLRPLLAHRWPLLTIGGSLTGCGLLIAWLMFLQASSRGSLDDATPRQFVGRLTQVTAPRTFAGARWQEVGYDFEFVEAADPERPTHVPQRVTCSGLCFVPAGDHAVGDEVVIEVSSQDPNTHRVVGGLLLVERDWQRARFWLVVMVVPGGLLLLGWLASAMQLRQVLVHGDVSVGHVTKVVRVPLVMPEMFSVRFEFIDHRAIRRSSRHWVRSHGALGARLAQADAGGRPEALPVLHDRRFPQRCRLLLPTDYLPSPVRDVLPTDGAP